MYMKNIFSLSIFLFLQGIGVCCFSQNSNLNKAISLLEDYEKYNELKSLPNAKTRIDSATVNPATSDKYKTWFYRGQIYLALFEQSIKNEMTKIQETDVNKKIIAAYFNISMADAEEALKGFQKELTLDDKKVYTPDATSRIKTLAGYYGTKALALLINKNYADAITYYETSCDLKLKTTGINDTAAIYNLAVATRKNKNYKKAEDYYTKLIELKYENPEKWYLEMIWMNSESGDMDATANAITKARAAMPDSYPILVEEINLYSKSIDKEENRAKSAELSQKAITDLNTGITKNPKEAQLHLVLAGIYSKLAFPRDKNNNALAKPENFNELVLKAEDEYKKALELKPDFQNNYTLGIYYNNWCADIVNQLDNIKDIKKKKAEEKSADDLLQKAIPLLEKAHELDPKDKDTMRTLRQLYARTGQGESEKYKKLDAEFKGVK